MANDSEERQAVSPVAESSEQTVEQTEVEQTTGQAETSGVSPEASELVTFEDGDIITDGEETIGIFKKEFDNYYEMYIEGHFRDGELKYLYFDTISFKNENVKYRRLTGLEKLMFKSALRKSAKFSEAIR